MPRPGMGPRVNEKSKDFFGSIKRLFSNLKPWRVLLGVSLVLAMASAILTLVAPKQLSKFTDIITLGLKPNMEKITDLIELVMENATPLDEEKINEIMSNSSISVQEKDTFQSVLVRLQNVSEEKEIAKIMVTLPDSIITILLNDFVYNGVLISKNDQMEGIGVIKSLLQSATQDDILREMDTLPKSIYNIIKPGIDMDKIRLLSLLLISLYLVSSIFGYIQSFSMSTISNNFAYDLRHRISEKINRLPLKYFDNHETGDVLSRVTNDVDIISQNLNQSLATLVSSITLFIGSIIMMFTTNWVMTVTAIFSTLIGFVFMFLILKKSQKYFTKRQAELGKINGYIEELYSAHNVVKAYNGEREAIQEFSDLNNKLYDANRKSQFLSGLMQPIMGFIGNFGYVMVCIIGALLTMNGSITFGVIVAFIIYVRLFTNPLSQIAQAMTSLQSTAAASERVFEFLDEMEMVSEDNLVKKLDKEQVEGNIEFKNVQFGYDASRMIIKDFSVSVKKGQKIAIVGPTGAGKTTLVNLLMKFYEINQGDILIDGVSIKELSRENIHDLFCMVLQDTWLFEGSIKENIKFNNEAISDEEIWNALRVVGVDHFVKTLPLGLKAKVGDNDSISQGQKQLLTIARGMIENSPFLILDEATSNVDTRTEELVQKAMDKLTVGRTSFIIAHRLSTIKNADLILVMRDGNIVEQGNHEDLMKLNGFYAELYNSQFEL